MKKFTILPGQVKERSDFWYDMEVNEFLSYNRRLSNILHYAKKPIRLILLISAADRNSYFESYYLANSENDKAILSHFKLSKLTFTWHVSSKPQLHQLNYINS